MLRYANTSGYNFYFDAYLKVYFDRWNFGANSMTLKKIRLQLPLCSILPPAILLILAFSFGPGCLSVCGAESVVITKASNGKEIRVRTGAILQIELEQPAEAGLAWEVQSLDRDYFSVQNIRTGERKKGSESPALPAMKTFRIKAVRTGSSKLTFIYRVPWQGEEKARETFEVTVTILTVN
jgi:predicted secreted protein